MTHELAPRVDTGGTSTTPSSVHPEIDSLNGELLAMSEQFEREMQMERLGELLENEMEMKRQAQADIARITAPASRAGYLVAGIVGLLVFWFLTTIVFDGNSLAKGILIVCTALYFLVLLKSTLEKKGARYIAGTGGVALGVM